MELFSQNGFHEGAQRVLNMNSPPLHTICRRPAMNTLFEIVVSGEDVENEVAAAEAALDEIVRVELVLSRFDPASEVARVNREAHQRPILVSHELLAIIELCQNYSEKTSGYFDISAGSEMSDERAAELHSAELLSNPLKSLVQARRANPSFLPSAIRQHADGFTVDAAARKILFTVPGLRLDFGAFGKGYALDCAAQILKASGVQNALLHGGTSSVLAMGTVETVALRNPWNSAEELETVVLCNQSLSSSATFSKQQTTSDLIDPHRRAPLCEDAACVVIGPTAAEAEIFSTALLCMGRERAGNFCAENMSPDLQVFWITKVESQPRIESLPTML